MTVTIADFGAEGRDGGLALAPLERAVANEHRFDLIDRAVLHRASFESDLTFLEGRDLLRERRIADAAVADRRKTEILFDLGDMIVFAVGGDGEEGWRGHRWARREKGWISAETLVIDGGARAAALGFDRQDAALALGRGSPVHAPLGELRPGRGQLAESVEPRLPGGWPDAARAAATYLHRVWNCRALGLISAERWHGPDGLVGDAADQRRWLLGLLSALPDAALLFDRAVVSGDKVAIAWRLHGHHLGEGLGQPPTGRRVRALGSSLLEMDGALPRFEDMLVDMLGVEAQLHRPQIEYSSPAMAAAAG